jgi:hypothetical protein
MTNSIHADMTTSNVHPADALADIRAEIKALQVKENLLREALLKDGASLKGNAYEASIDTQKSNRLDQDKLTKALGNLDPYKSEHTTVMVRVKRLKQSSKL